MSNRILHLLTPDILLKAYAAGIFPMAESAQATELHWFDPPIRAIIPLDQFHIPTKLRRLLRKKPYKVSLNRDFNQVIRGCAERTSDRSTTWINREILTLYTTLHLRGHCHSLEVWEGQKLVGGLYGISLGGAFFGESMFSRADDASKVALVALVALLRSCQFRLLDTQFQTTHLAQFGTTEITRTNYHHYLKEAISLNCTFELPYNRTIDQLVDELLQPVTQIS